jgi:3-deoxy-D-manno-octulosonic-acid transferase
MKYVIDFLYLLASLAISPMVLYRMFRQNRYRIGWANRFGKVSRKNLSKKCIWIHAVSVGEINATITIISELEQRFPDLEIVISTTTDTGFARADSLFADRHTVIFFPLDFSWVRYRAFRSIKPSLCLFMELEVWPNFVNIAQELNIPVVVANGRISEKSFVRYKLIKPFAEKIFKKLTLILAQTDQYAQLFKEIGCQQERVLVTGSLKYDTAQITDKINGADEIVEKLNIKAQKLWVAGGTGNDEEKILLEVFRKLQQKHEFHDLHLVIVPRKPERFEQVAQQIKQAGFALIRYSHMKKDKTTIPSTDSQTIILGDTMGDLRKFYSLATIIFVGRSLVPMGGSDMMEAAALGKCTMFGPHASNFKQTVDDLVKNNGALLVESKNDLLEKMKKCLLDQDFAQSIAEKGQDVIRKNQGATKKTIDAISKFLN